MKLETIYNELKEYTEEQNISKLLDLMSKIEKQIRLETCYKTSSKTRINAIKRVASKLNIRPALTGYSIQKGYKFVTDSYHLIAIKQEDMPLPLVATKSDLEELDIDYKKYMEEHGRESILNFDYPNVSQFLEFSRDNELPKIDINDLTSFIKINKKDKNALYEINGSQFNPQFIKNVIDVLGVDSKVYYQGEFKPLYFENDNNEIGLVLPCRKF